MPPGLPRRFCESRAHAGVCSGAEAVPGGSGNCCRYLTLDVSRDRRRVRRWEGKGHQHGHVQDGLCSCIPSSVLASWPSCARAQWPAQSSLTRPLGSLRTPGVSTSRKTVHSAGNQEPARPLVQWFATLERHGVDTDLDMATPPSQTLAVRASRRRKRTLGSLFVYLHFLMFFYAFMLCNEKSKQKSTLILKKEAACLKIRGNDIY